MQLELTIREAYSIIRKRHGITLKQVAEHLNMDDSVLSRYERYQYDLKPLKERQYRSFIDKAKEKR